MEGDRPSETNEIAGTFITADMTTVSTIRPQKNIFPFFG
jgi:hypothetical protein